MAAAHPMQTNFNAGVLGPTLGGRVDIDKYANGCFAMENMIPLVQGPARRRSGTRFVAEVKDSNDRGWLVRFQFSDDVAFIIEFGDQHIRFYTNHGQLLTGAVAAWSNAVNYTEGDLVSRLGVTYYCKVAHINQQPPNATYWHPLTADLYEIPAPYTAAQLTKADGTLRLWLEQSGDVIYVFHPSYPVHKLTRHSNTRWTLTPAEFKGGPFVGVNPDETRTVYASAATGAGITLTASSAIFDAVQHVGSLFLIEAKLTDDVLQWEPGKAVAITQERRSDGSVYLSLNAATTGSVKPIHLEGARYDGDGAVQWQYLHSGYGIVRITAVGGGGTTATATVLSRIPSQAVGAGNPTTRWSFSPFSPANGFPSHGTFWKERLWLFRKIEAWASVAADFDDFSNRDGPDVTTDMAITISSIASDEINDVAWVAPGQKLLVGTVGAEFAIGKLAEADPLGPGNVDAVPHTGHGGRQVRPAKINDSYLFPQKSGRKLREIRFTFESEGYATTDLNVLAEHVLKGQVVQMAYQQEPHSIVWCACKNGELIGFTFNREQKVYGWHPHPIGGGGFVESVACIPTPDGTVDEVWMIVRRTINGVTKRYVEFMERDWITYEGALIEDAFFVDSGLSYSGAPADVISGLDHLEGQMVQVLADGSVHPDCLVVSGDIQLNREASKVQAGLACPAKVTTMRVEVPTHAGTAQGKLKRIVKTVFRLLDTVGGVFGVDGGQMDELLMRSSADPMDAPLPVFTGDTEPMAWPDGWEYNARITVAQTQPLPMTLLAIIPELEV